MGIAIAQESRFTPEMERLRRYCFPGAYVTGTSEDEFDRRSWHLTIRMDDTLAAYARLTPGPNGVFETWTNGKAQIPTGADVLDLCRCAVGPDFRGQGLLRLLCVEGLLAAAQFGFRHVVGAVIPGEPFEAMLHNLGLRPTGGPVEELEPSGDSFVVQPLACEVRLFASGWHAVRTAVLAKLVRKGTSVYSVG